jgi:tRNA1(Val) A37 N6-methylase TrmN6
VKFTAIESDVYNSHEVKHYDLIVATPPYAEGDVTDPILSAYYGGRHFLIEFFARADEFLAKDGKLLICCPNWGDKKLFDAQTAEHGFTSNTLASKTSADGERVYYLYECVRARSSK